MNTTDNESVNLIARVIVTLRYDFCSVKENMNYHWDFLSGSSARKRQQTQRGNVFLNKDQNLNNLKENSIEREIHRYRVCSVCCKEQEEGALNLHREFAKWERKSLLRDRISNVVLSQEIIDRTISLQHSTDNNFALVTRRNVK